MTARALLAVTAALLAMGQGAAAQEVLVFGGAELELTFPDEGSTAELSAYVGVESQGFYGGALAKAADDPDAHEIQLTFGYQAELESGFAYDLSYTRYFYPNDGGDCCGEITLAIGQAIDDTFSVGAELTADPSGEDRSLELGVAWQATEVISLSATHTFLQDEEPGTAREWDLGATYDLSDEAAVDLRYYDGSDIDGYLGLTLTFETTLLGG